MLTLTLRSLERDGLVTRTVFPTVPPRVDYELTALGRSLLVPVSALGDWARKNMSRIDDAQAKFDSRKAKVIVSGAQSLRPAPGVRLTRI
jgi:DNA-binding HxlR family transcriptional regulator